MAFYIRDEEKNCSCEYHGFLLLFITTFITYFLLRLFIYVFLPRIDVSGKQSQSGNGEQSQTTLGFYTLSRKAELDMTKAA